MDKATNRFSVNKKNKISQEYSVYIDNIFVSFPLPKKLNFFKKIYYKIKKIKIIQEIPDAKYFNGKFLFLKKITRHKLMKRKIILKGVSLFVRKGETLALIGANGAGKTVLMETLLGLNKIDSGQIYLNLGKKSYKENLKEAGIQFQQSKFPNRSKVKTLINSYKKLYGKKVDKDQLEEMINIFGIRDFYNEKINKLSGGQKQRINLLLSIMHNPKLMILDEFITGLDIRSVRKIVTYVNDLKVKNNSSMIIISHQPEEVQELSDRIIVLNNGVITLETNTNNVLEKYDSMASFIEENI